MRFTEIKRMATRANRTEGTLFATPKINVETKLGRSTGFLPIYSFSGFLTVGVRARKIYGPHKAKNGEKMAISEIDTTDLLAAMKFIEEIKVKHAN